MRHCLPLLLLFANAAHAQDFPRLEGELDLKAAVNQSSQSSPRVLAARAELAAARQGVKVAKAGKSPELMGNVFGTSGTQESILSAAGVQPSAIMRVPEDEALIGNLMLMIPLYTGGRLEGRISQASAVEREAAGRLQEILGEVALMVSESYFMVGESAEMVLAEEARVKALDEALKNARAQFEAGRGIEASVMRAEAELAEATRDLATAHNEREKALLDLKEAMGVALDSPLDVKPVAILAELNASLDQLLTESKSRRGLLIAARARMEAASADARVAEGALKPQVYGTAMADSMRTRDMSESGYTLGLTLSLPLFDGGMRRAEVGQMRAMRQSTEAMLRETELMVGKQVRQAWLDVQTSLANARSAQASLKSAESAYEVIALRVDSGKGILLERLDALQSLTRARTELASASYEYRIALSRLERAAGLVPGSLIQNGDSKL
jgi:outer membrane protein